MTVEEIELSSQALQDWYDTHTESCVERIIVLDGKFVIVYK
jgi:hypothetical protein